MLAPERLQRLFDGLATTLATAQEEDEAYEAEHLAGLARFFAGLAPAITVAVEAQKVLDRVAATNFSVFRYFEENENLVSGIFADLLRPDGSHGQGTVFLRLFLKEIDRGGKACIRKSDAYGSLERCSVYTEYLTDEGRRVDIVIKLEDMWIGVENKPWANEQPNQVQHYLQFLQRKEADAALEKTAAEVGNAQACVLYLSGTGDHAGTIEDDDHYLTIPYGHTKDGPSVAHWIAECHRRCEADKVRWFLKDLLEYIARMFYAEELGESL